MPPDDYLRFLVSVVEKSGAAARWHELLEGRAGLTPVRLFQLWRMSHVFTFSQQSLSCLLIGLVSVFSVQYGIGPNIKIRRRDKALFSLASSTVFSQTSYRFSSRASDSSEHMEWLAFYVRLMSRTWDIPHIKPLANHTNLLYIVKTDKDGREMGNGTVKVPFFLRKSRLEQNSAANFVMLSRHRYDAIGRVDNIRQLKSPTVRNAVSISGSNECRS